MSKRFLIACGGTGGHLSPGIALAEELARRGHQATLLISHKKVDTKLVEKYPQWSFVRVPGSGFGWAPSTLVRFLVSQSQGLLFSFRLVRKVKPHAVIGFGGFTTSTIIVTARLLRVPVVLHEANRVPGRAIRMLGRLARRIYLPSGVTLGTSRRGVERAMGLPVRREILPQSRAAAMAALGLDPALPVLVVLGGSQGASALNTWVEEAAPQLAAVGWQVYGVTGLGKGSELVRHLPGPGGARVAFHTVPFCDRMGTLLSAADVAVTRAGAGTLAELTLCQVPSVMIPYPQAADNHQAANAAAHEALGGGLCVAQTDMARLTEVVLHLLGDAERREAMRQALGRSESFDTVQAMGDDLEALTVAQARADQEEAS